ncbi:Fpg/Nei family DNA glycosylase [Actinospica sp. MGRD01-02]|uniref:Fpg/Nei family DNA glycosylase n=1 Tax=Actinospica acidithermotolerans TaxID=2828514 RepID=A0A941EH91_9ACTN|nr:DNA-formamidopyrimidine glycosylase family protein [Actinospica acidithermotolerans]MBR7830635.1 Fpg/Nei family DNA glycosylase [Actinospica acidithermotolerans]
MPELPEVEALAAFLDGKLAGRTVAAATPVAFQALKTYDPPLSAIEGLTFDGVGRRGKFLDLRVGDLHLVVHLARAGWIRWKDELPSGPVRPGKGPLALRLRLAEPESAGFDVTEAGTQKRLAFSLVRDPAEVPGVASLGIEPLSPEFTAEVLRDLLRTERRQIKGVLRDQGTIAGIGNAYSDEILHAAKMSPFKIAARLTPTEVDGLHAVAVATLTEAVERSRGLPLTELKSEKKSGLRVHGRKGEPCPVCGDTIREVSFSDSALQYCPTCQTGGKPLADRRLSRLLK